jgi:hypothetical protein
MSEYFNISKTANVDFVIPKNDYFYFNCGVLDENDNQVDLSDYTSAKMQVRENEYADPVLTFTSSGGTIDISNLVAGQIILAQSTSGVVANTYYYDLELKNNTYRQTVMAGRFFVKSDFSL